MYVAIVTQCTHPLLGARLQVAYVDISPVNYHFAVHSMSSEMVPFQLPMVRPAEAYVPLVGTCLASRHAAALAGTAGSPSHVTDPLCVAHPPSSGIPCVYSLQCMLSGAEACSQGAHIFPL